MPGTTCGDCITHTELIEPIYAKIVRIWPSSCVDHNCAMRFEVYFEEDINAFYNMEI